MPTKSSKKAKKILQKEVKVTISDLHFVVSISVVAIFLAVASITTVLYKDSDRSEESLRHLNKTVDLQWNQKKLIDFLNEKYEVATLCAKVAGDKPFEVDLSGELEPHCHIKGHILSPYTVPDLHRFLRVRREDAEFRAKIKAEIEAENEK